VSAFGTEAALTLEADLQEVTRLKAWLEALGRELRLDPGLVERLNYCSEELFTNIVAYNPGLRAKIRMRLDARGTQATLAIEDDGTEFDPTRVPPPVKPRTLEEAPIGGLGVHLVRQFSSGMEYERRGGTNHLVVRFGSAATQAERAS
jgi:serine/threonine-protein kinase RsbW